MAEDRPRAGVIRVSLRILRLPCGNNFRPAGGNSELYPHPVPRATTEVRRPETVFGSTARSASLRNRLSASGGARRL